MPPEIVPYLLDGSAVSSRPAGFDPDPGARRRPVSCEGAPAMADYIPGGDAEFNTWLDNFVTYAGANLANLWE